MSRSDNIPAWAPLLVLGGIVLIASKIKSGGLHPVNDPSDFRNLQLRISGVHMEQSDIVINVEMSNPNSESFEVKSFVGSMLVSHTNVGTVQMFGDYIVRGNAKLSIPLIVKPKLSALMQQVQQTFRKKGTVVSFSGTMNVNNRPIPLTLQYAI